MRPSGARARATSISGPLCAIGAQIEALREAAERGRRREVASKAVLGAATKAAREMRTLSRQEVDAIEAPILNPPSPEQLRVEREAQAKVLTRPGRFVVCSLLGPNSGILGTVLRGHGDGGRLRAGKEGCRGCGGPRRGTGRRPGCGGSRRGRSRFPHEAGGGGGRGHGSA